MALEVKFTFDDKTYRHYLNGIGVVQHCHHYMSLLTKLAVEMEPFGGLQILAESVEDTMRPLLDRCNQASQAVSPAERLDVAKHVFEIIGMGQMEVSGDAGGGEVTLTRSHVDQGWIAKFGKNDVPVNHWTRGYLAAVFAVVYEKPARSYQVEETASMVSGEPVSRFTVTAN